MSEFIPRASPLNRNFAELTAALTPLLRDYVPQSTRGFFGFSRGADNAATLWAQAIFRAADTDKNGKLTLDEFTTLADRLACLADRDQDDKLDEREIIEALDSIAEAESPSAQGEFLRRSARNQPPAREPAPARRNGGRAGK